MLLLRRRQVRACADPEGRDTAAPGRLGRCPGDRSADRGRRAPVPSGTASWPGARAGKRGRWGLIICWMVGQAGCRGSSQQVDAMVCQKRPVEPCFSGLKLSLPPVLAACTPPPSCGSTRSFVCGSRLTRGCPRVLHEPCCFGSPTMNAAASGAQRCLPACLPAYRSVGLSVGTGGGGAGPTHAGPHGPHGGGCTGARRPCRRPGRDGAAEPSAVRPPPRTHITHVAT